jgi:hypothetical protein
MSYDIAIVIPPIADMDASAWQELDRLIEEQGEPPDLLRVFYQTLVQRYPCLSMLGDDEDSGVWSSAPLWSDFGPMAATLAIQYPHAEAVVPFVIETARSLGLTAFDWQTKLVHRPGGFADLELSSEGVAPFRHPTLQQIMDAAQTLTPDGGPGFLTLERAGRDYLQVAGGKGAYMCEWRMFNEMRFTHFAIGLSTVASKVDIQIATNGFHVTVQQNEKLTLTNIKALLSAFAGGDDPPAAYTLRDISERFQ